jgi:hypothetical protein
MHHANRHARITEHNRAYTVQTWYRENNQTTAWKETRNLNPWLCAYRIACEWVKPDFSGLE